MHVKCSLFERSSRSRTFTTPGWAKLAKLLGQISTFSVLDACLDIPSSGLSARGSQGWTRYIRRTWPSSVLDKIDHFPRRLLPNGGPRILPWIYVFIP